MTISRMLVGTPLHQDKYAPTGLQESMLHDLDMGYYELDEKDPFRSIRWVKEENAYNHQFSLEEIGREYAFNRLQEYIPLELYLNLPNVILEDLINGLINGRNERHLHDEEIKKKDEVSGKSPEEDFEKLVERADKLNKI